MILPIRAYGDPVLKKVAKDIEPGHPGLEQLIADMWEEDGSTNELSADDDFGIAGLLLEFGDGWGGERHIVTHGTGTNSVDVGVGVDVK